MKLIGFLAALLGVSLATDYLGGNGIFSATSQLTAWNWVNSSNYVATIETSDSRTYLSLTKPSTASNNFDDGLYYYFGNERPVQIHIEISTNSASNE
jgi:hypothetical protein